MTWLASNGANDRDQAQGHGRPIILVGQVLQEIRAVPQRQYHQARAEGRRREVMPYQPPQGQRHGEGGDKQRQRENIGGSRGERQRPIEQLDEQPALFFPVGTGQLRTPAVIDIEIVREDQWINEQKGCDGKKDQGFAGRKRPLEQ
ncbi:hypothetical protein D3C75_1039950 [compost metagenome]